MSLERLQLVINRHWKVTTGSNCIKAAVDYRSEALEGSYSYSRLTGSAGKTTLKFRENCNEDTAGNWVKAPETPVQQNDR